MLARTPRPALHARGVVVIAGQLRPHSHSHSHRLRLRLSPPAVEHCTVGKCVGRKGYAARAGTAGAGLSTHHDHDHHHYGHHHHHHHHDHDHHYGHHHYEGKRAPLHQALDRVFHATGISALGSFLREHPAIAVIKVVLFIIAAASSWASSGTLAASTLRKVSTLTTIAVFVLTGIPAAMDMAYNLVAGRIDTHVLMNLAAIGTTVTGYPLEGALLLVLFQTSHSLEHALTAKARGNLKALDQAIPHQAELVMLNPESGQPEMHSATSVPVSEVEIGQLVAVKPGTQVPLDGVVEFGRALVSVEHITGEPLPVLRRVGDALPAGALSHDGVLVVRVTQTEAESTPRRILRLARDAQALRPRLRTWLDRFGEVYSKAVILASLLALAVLVAAGVPLLPSAGAGIERGALHRAMGLLTVASPCALVLVPLAYVSAIAAMASRGILLKGGRVLDAIDTCRIVGLDKTGTLTTGRLTLTQIRSLDENMQSIPDKTALAVAAALSLHSTHPVSTAVVEDAVKKAIDLGAITVTDFTLVAGGGVSGTVSTSGGVYNATFGSIDFVAEELDLDEKEKEKIQRATEDEENGASLGSKRTRSVLVLSPVSQNTSKAMWMTTFEDTVRGLSWEAVEVLRSGKWAGGVGRGRSSRACEVVMLTGDNEASARGVAGTLGIDRVAWGLKPEDKLRLVQELRDEGVQGSLGSTGVMMVGDGLNDAAALAAADVGVAIASSSPAAASLASDAVVMNEGAGISAIPLLLRVARATRYVIAQNLVLAAGSILILAAPTVLGILPLWVAVMLHEGSTLLVALNSLRLLRFSGRGGGSKQGQGKE